eukprot:116953-Heterocapsa_arctica.AAC.1
MDQGLVREQIGPCGKGQRSREKLYLSNHLLLGNPLSNDSVGNTTTRVKIFACRRDQNCADQEVVTIAQISHFFQGNSLLGGLVLGRAVG